MKEETKMTKDETMGDAVEGGEVKKAKKEKAKRPKKVKGEKMSDKQDKKLIGATVAIVTAFVIFIVLTVIQDRIINGTTTSPVVVAVKEVPAGTELDERNMANYFKIEQRVIDQIPNAVETYATATNMIGKVTDRVIRPREIVTSDCFIAVDFYDSLEQPVEISLDLGAIGQTVGGVLRAGDYVDIKAVVQLEKEETFEDWGFSTEYTGGLLDLQVVEIVEESTEESVEDIGEEIEAESTVKLNEKDAEKVNTVDSEDDEVGAGVNGEYVAQTLAENVRVTRVFNSGGEDPERVDANGAMMVATVINIAVPKDKVDAILIAQEEGVISLVRIENPDAEAATE